MQVLRVAARAAGMVALVVFALWAAAAAWYDGPGSAAVRAVLAAGILASALVAGLASRRRGAPVWLAAIVPGLVLAWWLTLSPRADRDWMPDVGRTAHAEIDGDILTVHNVRNFRYRSESDPQPAWETRRYRLDQLVGYDLFLSFWGPTLYAHTISSWEFADGSHLAISIETRKERGESYSAVAGFFRQYELHYVVADERDVIGGRAAHRGERIYLYRLRSSPEKAREGLLDFVARLNRLARQPAWYNALTTNCTTSIWHHLRHVAPKARWDWRLLANGRLDELAWERGTVSRELPFEALRARSDVTARAAAAVESADFSARIREGLPSRPGGVREETLGNPGSRSGKPPTFTPQPG